MYVNDEVDIFCKFELENCSSVRQEFKIKVVQPYWFEDVKRKDDLSYTYIFDKTVSLEAYEKRTVELKQCFKKKIKRHEWWDGSTEVFEFSLFNDKQEVNFLSSSLIPRFAHD